MCTVSIFPKKNNDFVLTSNRDEAPNRIAVAPEFYTLNNVKVLLPKDELSGGSWIGVSENNRVVCLLNGGFNIHKRKTEYRHSRGIVVNELLVCEDIETSIEIYNLQNIEPFTVVIADWNEELKFYELVWDGEKKHITNLLLDSYIWSSSTLYTEEKKQERAKWFEDFKSKNELTSKTILKFHKTAGKGNLDYGTVMDRGFVKTTSITQIEKTGDIVTVYFENLNTSEISTKTFNLPTLIDE